MKLVFFRIFLCILRLPQTTLLCYFAYCDESRFQEVLLFISRHEMKSPSYLLQVVLLYSIKHNQFFRFRKAFTVVGFLYTTLTLRAPFVRYWCCIT